MIVCMVTPHLPPDQAANALLPQLLHDGLEQRGHEVRLMAFQPRASTTRRESTDTPDGDSHVRYVRPLANGWRRKLRLSQIATGFSVWRAAHDAFRDADVVHIHSNTFMNQVAAAIAHRRGIPYLLTHYGTEIWHYQPRAIDPFLWMNEHAAHVTYYSRLLLEKSLELGVAPPHRAVVYPPVDERFRAATATDRSRARRELDCGDGPLLLNVKRLHPLAGQRFLIEAMPTVLESFPQARLWVAGEGEARGELEEIIRRLKLEGSVRLLGLVDNRELPRYYHAADLFVLPSRLEAFPTVAAEALASGLRVVSADHPGGLELGELFPEDVELVPREDVPALAGALVAALEQPRRCSEKSLARIESELRPDAAMDRYLELYEDARREMRGDVARD